MLRDIYYVNGYLSRIFSFCDLLLWDFGSQTFDKLQSPLHR